MTSVSKKKWIFSRRNRAKSRFMQGLLFGCVALLLGAVLGLGIDFYRAIPQKQPVVVQPELYRGLVVFTGGQGRVQTGFEVLEVFDETAFFLISGVNPALTREAVLNIESWQEKAKAFVGHIDLDYQGQSTFGNIEQTKLWVQKHGLEAIVVVTSDYHMPRVSALFAAHLPHINVLAYPVIAAPPGWRLFATEFAKYAAVRLALGAKRLF